MTEAESAAVARAEPRSGASHESGGEGHRVKAVVNTAAGTIVARLRAHGVDRIFCLPGESHLAILDVLRDLPEIDVVSCRHEAAAAFAALADAKLTGRAGICLVSRGPGAAQAAIAVHTAAQDAAPLVLIVGQVTVSELGRASFQELDCLSAFAPMTKGAWLLLDPANTAEFVERSLLVAESGTPGPCVLVIPEDVLSQPDPTPAVRHAPPTVAMPAQLELARVAQLLARAQRPLLIAGGRLSGPAGRRAVAIAAERLALPVATSNKHQDIFDNRHPNYVGHLHNNTPVRQREMLEQADVILAVGTRLDPVTTGRRRLPRSAGQTLIHVYPDGSQLGGEHTPTFGLAVDPASLLLALIDHPDIEHGATRETRRAWIAGLRAYEEAKAEYAPRQPADGLAFGTVVAALDELTGGDVIVAVDAGTFTSWTYRHLRFSGAGRLIGAAGSPMGFGVPAGIAAALRLGRRVLAVVGDGGFLMTGSELSVAAARRLPITIVIADNRSYGTIRLAQERRFPGRVIATDLTNPDFVQLAEAYGVPGLRVDHEAQVTSALSAALRAEGPVVVAVKTSLSCITAYHDLASVTRPDGNPQVQGSVLTRDLLAKCGAS